MGAWEGVGDTGTRKSGNPAVGYTNSPFEPKEGVVMSSLRAGFRLLAISILLLCFSLPVFAETPTESLPETVITSTRLPGDPVDPLTLPAKVTVITAEDIHRQGAKTAQEAIQ